jgi:hypothetical protein
MEKESIVVFELSFFASNIKNKVCGVLDFCFYCFLKEENKAHNMLSWMLDPRFKN